MKPILCDICTKETHKFYELKSFPVNIYQKNKNKFKKKKLKIFFCKFCNHISISKLKSEIILYKSYKKKNVSNKFNKLSKNDKKKNILEISKEKPIVQKGFKIDHKKIFKNDYLNITKKYNKIIINDCISNIYNIKKFFRKISDCLEQDGEIEILHHYGPGVIKNLNIDRVYFEHINNFSYKSLNFLINQYELTIKSFKLFENRNFFKAILIKKNLKFKNKILINENFDLIKKSDIEKFINRINQITFKLKKDLGRITFKNKENNIYGYGASIGSVAIIKFLNLDKYINKLIDNFSELKFINLDKKIIKIEKKFHKNYDNLVIFNLAPRYKFLIKKKVFNNSDKKISYFELLPSYNLIKKMPNVFNK